MTDISSNSTFIVPPYISSDLDVVTERLRKYAVCPNVSERFQQSTEGEMTKLLTECLAKPITTRGWVAVGGQDGEIVGSIFGRQRDIDEPYDARDGFRVTLFDRGDFARYGWDVAEELIEVVKTVIDDETWEAVDVIVPTDFKLPEDLWRKHGYNELVGTNTSRFMGCDPKRKSWCYFARNTSEQSQKHSETMETQI